MSSIKSDKMNSSVSNALDNINKKEMLNKTFLTKMTDMVKHRKFKWFVILVLLLVAMFYYLKSQNKSKVKNNMELNTNLSENYRIINDPNGNPILINLNKNVNNNSIPPYNNQAVMPQSSQQMNEHNTMHKNPMPQMNEHNTMHNNPMPQMNVPDSLQNNSTKSDSDSEEIIRNIEQSDTNESASSENFSEDDNLKEHDLTQEEMDAIDRQLNEVNTF